MGRASKDAEDRFRRRSAQMELQQIGKTTACFNNDDRFKTTGLNPSQLSQGSSGAKGGQKRRRKLDFSWSDVTK